MRLLEEQERAGKWAPQELCLKEPVYVKRLYHFGCSQLICPDLENELEKVYGEGSWWSRTSSKAQFPTLLDPSTWVPEGLEGVRLGSLGYRTPLGSACV